jgi:hypothetical protein
MLTLKRTLLPCLCVAAGLTLALGDDRNPKPRKSDVRRLRNDRDHIMIFGQKVKLPPGPALSPEAQAKADQEKTRDAHWAAMENEYVQDPRNPFTSSLPNPPGVQVVRAVLNQWRPVPQDRLDYFAALDHDPLSDHYPRKKWWVYVKSVQPRPDGWIADVMVNVQFDMARVTGPGRRPTVSSFWCERYQLQGDVLTYQGGHHEPRLDAFRVPSIRVQ